MNTHQTPEKLLERFIIGKTSRFRLDYDFHRNHSSYIDYLLGGRNIEMLKTSRELELFHKLIGGYIPTDSVERRIDNLDKDSLGIVGLKPYHAILYFKNEECRNSYINLCIITQTS